MNEKDELAKEMELLRQQLLEKQKKLEKIRNRKRKYPDLRQTATNYEQDTKFEAQTLNSDYTQIKGSTNSSGSDFIAGTSIEKAEMNFKESVSIFDSPVLIDDLTSKYKIDPKTPLVLAKDIKTKINDLPMARKSSRKKKVVDYGKIFKTQTVQIKPDIKEIAAVAFSVLIQKAKESVVQNFELPSEFIKFNKKHVNRSNSPIYDEFMDNGTSLEVNFHTVKEKHDSENDNELQQTESKFSNEMIKYGVPTVPVKEIVQANIFLVQEIIPKPTEGNSFSLSHQDLDEKIEDIQKISRPLCEKSHDFEKMYLNPKYSYATESSNITSQNTIFSEPIASTQVESEFIQEKMFFAKDEKGETEVNNVMKEEQGIKFYSEPSNLNTYSDNQIKNAILSEGVQNILTEPIRFSQGKEERENVCNYIKEDKNTLKSDYIFKANDFIESENHDEKSTSRNNLIFNGPKENHVLEVNGKMKEYITEGTDCVIDKDIIYMHTPRREQSFVIQAEDIHEKNEISRSEDQIIDGPVKVKSNQASNEFRDMRAVGGEHGIHVINSQAEFVHDKNPINRFQEKILNDLDELESGESQKKVPSELMEKPVALENMFKLEKETKFLIVKPKSSDSSLIQSSQENAKTDVLRNIINTPKSKGKQMEGSPDYGVQTIHKPSFICHKCSKAEPVIRIHVIEREQPLIAIQQVTTFQIMDNSSSPWEVLYEYNTSMDEKIIYSCEVNNYIILVIGMLDYRFVIVNYYSFEETIEDVLNCPTYETDFIASGLEDSYFGYNLISKVISPITVLKIQSNSRKRVSTRCLSLPDEKVTQILPVKNMSRIVAGVTMTGMIFWSYKFGNQVLKITFDPSFESNFKINWINRDMVGQFLYCLVGIQNSGYSLLAVNPSTGKHQILQKYQSNIKLNFNESVCFVKNFVIAEVVKKKKFQLYNLNTGQEVASLESGSLTSVATFQDNKNYIIFAAYENGCVHEFFCNV